MHEFVAFAPAASTAAGIVAQANNLARAIDSARRGAATDPRAILAELKTQLRALERELPRAA